MRSGRRADSTGIGAALLGSESVPVRCACRAMHSSRPPRRSAVTVVETIIWLPVLLIVLLSIVEFGSIMLGISQVEAAARFAAAYAADDPNGNLMNDSTMASAADAMEIRGEVDEVLETAGFGTAATQGVRFRENVGESPGDGSTAVDGTCDPDPLPMPNDSVRVTVCVPLTSVSPDLLSSFGFSLSGRFIEATATEPVP